MVRTVLVDASRKVQEAHNDQIASGSMVLRRARGYERLDRAGQIRKTRCLRGESGGGAAVWTMSAAAPCSRIRMCAHFSFNLFAAAVSSS